MNIMENVIDTSLKTFASYFALFLSFDALLAVAFVSLPNQLSPLYVPELRLRVLATSR